MAELFLARFSEREAVQRAVVVKLISSTYAEDKAFITMFEDEVRIAATLNHPNIVKVFEVGEVAGSHFLAMEHIFGRDLRTIVSRCLRRGGPVPIPVAVGIGASICAALQHAHTALAPDGTPLNIVHRDVSLSNIMVSYEGQVKLVDFGIAKAANRTALTLPGTIKGKARYLSPEQALGKEVDGRSDIYTLSTTLWEATVGNHLFDQALDVHVYEAVAKGWVKPPSEVVPDYPPELERILLKGLATDVDQRYTTAQQMQRDLEAYASKERFSLSSNEMSRFMHDLFEEDVSLWQHAQLSGRHLLDFLVERAAQEDHQGDDHHNGQQKAGHNGRKIFRSTQEGFDPAVNRADNRGQNQGQQNAVDIGPDDGETTEKHYPEKKEKEIVGIQLKGFVCFVLGHGIFLEFRQFLIHR